MAKNIEENDKLYAVKGMIKEKAFSKKNGKVCFFTFKFERKF